MMQLGRSKETGTMSYRAYAKGNNIMAKVVEAEAEKRWGEDPILTTTLK